MLRYLNSFSFFQIAKKQPNWDKDTHVSLFNKNSQQGIESYFRAVCAGFSQRKEKSGKRNPYCGYLHQNDPYLK